MLMNILTGVLLVLALVIIVVCTMVTGKSNQGAGSALGGGASDTYFNKSGAGGKDARLHAIMKIAVTLFVVLSLVMVVLQ